MKKNKIRNTGMIILGTLWLASTVSAYAQYQLSVFGLDIMGGLQINTTQFSALFTAPMLPAVFLSFLVGKMSDVIGSRRIIMYGLIITVCGLIGHIFATNYVSMVLCMALTGFSAIAVNVNSAKIISSHFKGGRISIMMGIFTTGGMLAQAFAMSTTATFFSDVKDAYIVAAIFGVIVTILWIVNMVKYPEAARIDGAGERSSILEVIKNKGIWLTGCCLMLTLGTAITLNSFLPAALMDKQGISQNSAGTIASLISLGNLFGAIFGPIIYQKMKSMKRFLLLLSVIAAVGCAFGWRCSITWLLGILMLITGIALGAAMPVFFAAPISIKGISSNNVATAGGLITTMQLAGAVIIPTYILTPLAGNNYNLLFYLAGGCILCVSALGILLNSEMTYN